MGEKKTCDLPLGLSSVGVIVSVLEGGRVDTNRVYACEWPLSNRMSAEVVIVPAAEITREKIRQVEGNATGVQAIVKDQRPLEPLSAGNGNPEGSVNAP